MVGTLCGNGSSGWVNSWKELLLVTVLCTSYLWPWLWKLTSSEFVKTLSLTTYFIRTSLIWQSNSIKVSKYILQLNFGQRSNTIIVSFSFFLFFLRWAHQVTSHLRNLAVNIWWSPLQSFNTTDCEGTDPNFEQRSPFFPTLIQCEQE